MYRLIIHTCFHRCQSNKVFKTKYRGETESEAIEIAERMADSEFDWSNIDDVQVTESDIEE